VWCGVAREYINKVDILIVRNARSEAAIAIDRAKEFVVFIFRKLIYIFLILL